MTITKIQYSFEGGELSDTLYGRTDYKKYDTALAKQYNWFTDYRGGMSTRAGLEFCVEILGADSTSAIYPFDFGISTANTYVMLFGDYTCRFVQDGGYVLEDSISISSVNIDSTSGLITVTTSDAHDYATGDLIYLTDILGTTELNNRTYVATVTSTTSFTLQQLCDSSNVDGSSYANYTSGGYAYRVYTVTTPYSASDLDDLHVEQRRDTVILTHPDYKPYKMVREAATDWTISKIDFGTTLSRPTGLAYSVSYDSSADTDSSVGYAVTQVKDGAESLPSRMLILRSVVNISTDEGEITLSWDDTGDSPDYYVIYRTLINPYSGCTAALQLGYLGMSYSTEFTDTNITPDFTTSCPTHYNPFADGYIDYITITDGGSDYGRNTATCTISGDGEDYEGYPIVNSSNEIIGVYTVNRGHDYTSATITFSDTGSGSGATGTVSIGSASGNNPYTSSIFQQRQIFGTTDNEPLGIFGTKPGEYTNMDYGLITSDSDSYEFELDTALVYPIHNFTALQKGLLAFSGSGVWYVTGDGQISVTPSSVTAQPQTFVGAANVPPIVVDNNVLYVEKGNSMIRSLEYNAYTEVYTPKDRSLLANHLFANKKQIEHWAWCRAPFYLVWSHRTDGKFLSFTFNSDQDIYAWAQHETLGLVRDVTQVLENGINAPYFMVDRQINGTRHKFLERMDSRVGGVNAEDFFTVDCGIKFGGTSQDGTLYGTINSSDSTVITLEAVNATPFTADNVGDIIRADGGQFRITSYTSSNTVVAKIKLAASDNMPDGNPRPTDSWTMDTPITEVGGLWHLEGETVVGLYDGNELAEQVVSGGKVTFPSEASMGCVGLAYSCIAKTLPVTVQNDIIEGRAYSISEAKIRLNATRGLAIGTSEDNAKEIKTRTTENYDQATNLISGYKNALVSGTFGTETQIVFKVSKPLPATVLSYVISVDAGDTNES